MSKKKSLQELIQQAESRVKILKRISDLKGELEILKQEARSMGMKESEFFALLGNEKAQVAPLSQDEVPSATPDMVVLKPKYSGMMTQGGKFLRDLLGSANEVPDLETFFKHEYGESWKKHRFYMTVGKPGVWHTLSEEVDLLRNGTHHENSSIIKVWARRAVELLQYARDMGGLKAIASDDALTRLFRSLEVSNEANWERYLKELVRLGLLTQEEIDKAIYTGKVLALKAKE
jgi:cell division septum initiation protein DivIVA